MKEEDLYDYNRSDLWDKIQYLPNKLRNAQFYTPNINSSYEKILAQNLMRIKAHTRTDDLAALKKRYPNPPKKS